jgi:hypothetical protein
MPLARSCSSAPTERAVDTQPWPAPHFGISETMRGCSWRRNFENKEMNGAGDASKLTSSGCVFPQALLSSPRRRPCLTTVAASTPSSRDAALANRQKSPIGLDRTR